MTDQPGPPTKLDIAEYGFESTAMVQQAMVGLLKHLQRLGLHVLPNGNENASIVQQLQLSSQPQLVESRTQPPTTNVSGSGQGGLAGGTSQALGDAEDQRVARTPATSSKSASAIGTSSTSVSSSPSVPSGRSSVLPLAAGTAKEYSLPVLSSDDRRDSLAAARQQVAGCRNCPELVISRKNTVYGEGSLNPRVCFFGEAPGADEDRAGKPFVGQAGQLLTKMIQACTFTREDCYIFNTIKCRPPGNRNPHPDEVANCRGFFEHQLEVLQPEYIVCLGLVAAGALLQTTEPVGRLRGVFHKYKTSKVIVTYHPAYLLRNPQAKRAAWDDLQMMLRDMGIDPKSGN